MPCIMIKLTIILYIHTYIPTRSIGWVVGQFVLVCTLIRVTMHVAAKLGWLGPCISLTQPTKTAILGGYVNYTALDFTSLTRSLQHSHSPATLKSTLKLYRHTSLTRTRTCLHMQGCEQQVPDGSEDSESVQHLTCMT